MLDWPASTPPVSGRLPRSAPTRLYLRGLCCGTPCRVDMRHYMSAAYNTEVAAMLPYGDIKYCSHPFGDCRRRADEARSRLGPVF